MSANKPMWPRRLKCAIGCLSAALLTQVAFGSQEIIADLSGTRYPGGGGGYGGALTFVEAADHGGVLAAFTDTQVPAGSLRVVDLDGYRIQTSRYTFSGGLSIGDADAGWTSNTLYKARVAVGVTIDPQWSLRVADQFVELGAIRGNLVNSTLEYHPVPVWGFKVGGGYSLNGTLADRYGEMAVHWYGAQHVFGGVVAGRTGYDPATLGVVAVVRQLRQEYIGAGIPFRRVVFNIVADNLTLDGASRQTIHLAVTVPL